MLKRKHKPLPPKDKLWLYRQTVRARRRFKLKANQERFIERNMK